MKFSENLKNIRHNAGISQEKLSDMCNIARSSISKYENGSQQPSLEVLEKLCECLKVSSDELLGIDHFKN